MSVALAAMVLEVASAPACGECANLVFRTHVADTLQPGKASKHEHDLTIGLCSSPGLSAASLCVPDS